MFMQQVNTLQRSKPDNVSSPVGGLNRRDALALMPKEDAYEMDNVLPGTTSCRVRKGTSIYNNLSGMVTSLLTYVSGTEQIMFAQETDTLYDVSEKDVALEVKTGLVGTDIQSTMFSNAADNKQWLICNTGHDEPFAYDGTAWANLVITDAGGASGSSALLNYVCPYKGRLYWAYRGLCGFYYLPPGAIQGAAEFFDLGQIAHKGGAVVGIATYSEDAGDGPHQYIVFITDQGEYIMYSGDDPGDATMWQLVGRYTGGRPIGRHAIISYAGDVLIITLDGVMQFSAIRKTADTRTELVALSSKLGDYFKAVVPYEQTLGWWMILAPKTGVVLVSAPDQASVTGRFSHFCMNTTTQAWARVRSNHWNGLCWTIFRDELYFGRYDGSIRRAFDTEYDVNEDIQIRVCQAYNYFGNSNNKQFKWVELLVFSEAPPALSGMIRVNFGAGNPTPIGQPPLTELEAVWDVSYWDMDFWGAEPQPRLFIVTYQNFGFVASLVLIGAFGGSSFEWYSSKWVYEEAQGLLG